GLPLLRIVERFDAALGRLGDVCRESGELAGADDANCGDDEQGPRPPLVPLRQELLEALVAGVLVLQMPEDERAADVPVATLARFRAFRDHRNVAQELVGIVLLPRREVGPEVLAREA